MLLEEQKTRVTPQNWKTEVERGGAEDNGRAKGMGDPGKAKELKSQGVAEDL